MRECARNVTANITRRVHVQILTPTNRGATTHVQTIDTRPFFPSPARPGNEATKTGAHVDTSCVGIACSMTEIMPKVCKNPFSPLLAHSTVHVHVYTYVHVYVHVHVGHTQECHSDMFHLHIIVRL